MLVDGHEDLALNAISSGRDYLGSTALEIRAREDDDPPGGACMLLLADWQWRGSASSSRRSPSSRPTTAFPASRYRSADEARAAGLAQLASRRSSCSTDRSSRRTRSRGGRSTSRAPAHGRCRARDARCRRAGGRGDARHFAIGTDWDGGQGVESAPAGIDTIADLPQLRDALGDAILGGNRLRRLRGWL